MKFWIRAAGAAAGLSIAAMAMIGGCEGSDGTGVPAAKTASETPVTDNPTGTVTWSKILGTKGVDAKIRVNDKGTDVVERPMRIVSAYSEAGDNILTLTPAPGNINGP